MKLDPVIFRRLKRSDLDELARALLAHGVRMHDDELLRMADVARDLGARAFTGQIFAGVLGANQALTLGGLTTLFGVNVWLPGSYLADLWMTGDNSTVAGACDLFPAQGAGTTLAAATPSTSDWFTGVAAQPLSMSCSGQVTVTATPATTAPQGINAGQPGAPGVVNLVTNCAAGTTGARARSTSLVAGNPGATGMSLLQLD